MPGIHITGTDAPSRMPELAVEFWTDGREDVVTYTVDGNLERPGEAVDEAREHATADGHEELNLKTVRLSED